MPYTLKPNKLLVKDPNGSGYLPQNVVTEKTTSEMVADITAAGNTEITAIGNKAAELDSKIDEADTAISKINALPGIIAGLRDLLDLVHPVGSVYISLDATNPGTLFGGTWEIIPGRFLLGTGNPGQNSDLTFGNIKYPNDWSAPPGTTGGEDFNQLVEGNLPAHTHPSFNGYDWGFPEMKNVANKSGIWPAPLNTGGHLVFGAESDGATYMAIQSTTGSRGGNVAHNNMPPYFSVYMWRRTA